MIYKKIDFYFSMPTAYEKYFLGRDADSFVRSKLNDGLTLSQEVGKKLDMTKVSAFTILPKNVPKSEILDFETGGKFPINENSVFEVTDKQERHWTVASYQNADFILFNSIEDFVSQQNDFFCVFENASLNSNDDYIKKLDMALLFFDDEVYHLISSGNASSSAKVMKIASSWMRNGFIFSAPRNLMKEIERSRKWLDREVILSIAESVVYIFISSYDGESNIICECK